MKATDSYPKAQNIPEKAHVKHDVVFGKVRYEKLLKSVRHCETPKTYFGDVLYASGGGFGPRTQRHYHLFILQRGSARFQVDDAPEQHLHEGQVALFLPGHAERFRFSGTQPTHHLWCSIHPSLVGKKLATVCIRAPRITTASLRLQRLLEIGFSLRPMRKGEKTFHFGLAENVALACLHEYLAAVDHYFDYEIHEKPDPVQRVIDWINSWSSGTESITLASLAREAGVSSRHLVRLFRRSLGITPIAYLWEIRTRYGMSLLRESKLSISEIAYSCGFRTPFHFARRIRQLTGVSPRAVRNQARKEKLPAGKALPVPFGGSEAARPREERAAPTLLNRKSRARPAGPIG